MVVPIFLFGAWQYASAAGWISPAYFPAPQRTLRALLVLISTGALWAAFGATALRMTEGWLAACATGVLLGAFVGSSPKARQYLSPVLEFLRPFPASAVIPAAILTFGLSNVMAIWVIAFGSLWPTLLSTVHGFSSISPRLREVATVLEIGPTKYLWKFALPSVLPDIFTGARISLSIALILAVVVEMQAALPGLGQNLLLAQRMFRSPDLYAGIIVLGAFGASLSAALDFLEGRVFAGRTSAQ